MYERKYRIEGNRLVKKENGVPIPDDEPVFVLRAKDKNALPAIHGYMMLCQNLNHRNETMKSIQDFKNFADQNPDRMKEPDS